MIHPDEEQKQAALEAGREGMKKAYERSRETPGLAWWERMLWVVLAGAAAAASCLLSGCGHSVNLGPEGAVVCKDGSCLSVSHGRLTFMQSVSEPAAPVVQETRK